MDYAARIRGVFREEFGEKVDGVVDGTRGTEQRVFMVSTGWGERVIKFPVEGRGWRFMGQRHAYELWHRAHVPIPKLFAFRSDYLIEERIPGVPASDAKLNLAARSRILYQLGGITRRMHSVRMRGYGELMLNGRGRFDSWAGFIRWRLRTQRFLPLRIERVLYGAVRDYGHLLDDTDPRLLHDDMTFDNIIVSGGRISGIVDMSDCISGEPMYDCAALNSTRFGDGAIPSFYRGYGKVPWDSIYLHTMLQALPWTRKSRKRTGRRVRIINFYADRLGLL